MQSLLLDNRAIAPKLSLCRGTSFSRAAAPLFPRRDVSACTHQRLHQAPSRACVVYRARLSHSPHCSSRSLAHRAPCARRRSRTQSCSSHARRPSPSCTATMRGTVLGRHPSSAATETSAPSDEQHHVDPRLWGEQPAHALRVSPLRQHRGESGRAARHAGTSGLHLHGEVPRREPPHRWPRAAQAPRRWRGGNSDERLHPGLPADVHRVAQQERSRHAARRICRIARAGSSMDSVNGCGAPM